MFRGPINFLIVTPRQNKAVEKFTTLSKLPFRVRRTQTFEGNSLRMHSEKNGKLSKKAINFFAHIEECIFDQISLYW